jgi:hypothetical protein
MNVRAQAIDFVVREILSTVDGFAPLASRRKTL